LNINEQTEEWKGIRFLCRAIGLLMLPGSVSGIILGIFYETYMLVLLSLIQICICVTLIALSFSQLPFRTLAVIAIACVILMFVNGAIATAFIIPLLPNA
jgi:hypothetical protein